ncbi:MAG: ZIP family metal transporter [Planctomycetota bacterium]|jgi:zinc and cadmium transporter|nr:ZIP family metal transporter [Planctomycetota bacterium]
MSAAAATFLAIAIVCLVSLLGLVTLALNKGVLRKILLPLVALAAGTMIGDAFLHLIPHAVEHDGAFTSGISTAILIGFVSLYLVEKVIHWQHSHDICEEDHVHPVAKINLVGDAFHNFLDGILIAGAFLSGGVPLGTGVTIAVALHEIPQEMGDFAILVHGGYSTTRALLFNLLSACFAFAGAGAVLAFGTSEEIAVRLMAFTAGAFIYIGASDLLPEIRKETRLGASVLLMGAFACGILLMMVLEEPHA